MITIIDLTYRGFGEHESIELEVLFPDTENIEKQLLNSSTLFYDETRNIYCLLKDDKPAVFSNKAMYKLLERLDESGGRYYLNICGKKILLTEKEI